MFVEAWSVNCCILSTNLPSLNPLVATGAHLCLPTKLCFCYVAVFPRHYDSAPVFVFEGMRRYVSSVAQMASATINALLNSMAWPRHISTATTSTE